MEIDSQKETLKQFKVVEKLIKKADVLVNAGDPDREGQLLVDEVFGYLNLSAERKSQIQRCLVSDLNPNAVSRAIEKLQKTAILYRLQPLLSPEPERIGCMVSI